MDFFINIYNKIRLPKYIVSCKNCGELMNVSEKEFNDKNMTYCCSMGCSMQKAINYGSNN